MISFIEYLNEMVWYKKPHSYHAQAMSKGHSILYPKPEETLGSEVSTIPETGHKIFKRSTKLTSGGGKYDYAEYSAWNPNTKKIDLMVAGHTRETGHYDVSNLRGYHGGTLRGHQLYKHLVHVHDLTIQSDQTQTKGARKTWQRLAKEPSVEVLGYNIKTNKYMKSKRAYATHRENPPNTERENYIGNFYRLIARKKK